MSDSSIQNVIAELSRLPQLSLVVQGLNELLAAEQQRRQEFYVRLKDDDKAEFINGEIIYQSPVKARHSAASDNLLTLMLTYARRHGLGLVGHEKLLVSLTRNDYEPAICFWRQERAQHFTPDQSHFPAPDLVAEVLSPSTEAIDRDVKFNDYAAHGVEEYWLVDPERETVEQYVLAGGAYNLLVKAQTGTLTSQQLVGFVVPVRAIFDAGEQLKALTQILRGSD